jgi:flagellar motor switch protein FliN/FliY
MSETQPAPDPTQERAAPEAAPRAGAPEVSRLDLVLDVPVQARVEIGSARLLVRELLQLDKGSVLELDRLSGDPADVVVNGRLVARGEITVVDERLAVRLVEVIGEGGGKRGG